MALVIIRSLSLPPAATLLRKECSLLLKSDYFVIEILFPCSTLFMITLQRDCHQIKAVSPEIFLISMTTLPSNHESFISLGRKGMESSS